MLYIILNTTNQIKNSSADWQQQVKHTPSHLHDLNLQSAGQHCNTSTIRPLPLIDNYHPYYPDPEFRLDLIGTLKSTTNTIYISTITLPKIPPI